MVTEELANFKKRKQLPAPEKKMGKRGKGSSKKPWVLKSKWKDGVKFKTTSSQIVDGKLVKKFEESFTLEELQSKKELGEIHKWDFHQAFWGPRPWGVNRYKSKKSALTAWESFCKKGGNNENGIYWIENEKTGEVIKL